MHEAEVRVPSDMIALGDRFAFVPRSSSPAVDYVAESIDGLVRQELGGGGHEANSFLNESVRRAKMRHHDQGNVAFCDGHVEAVPFRRLFLDRDDASLRRWNRDNEPDR